MDFYEVLEQVLVLLQRHGRVSYRALKRQFDLDDDYLDDLKDELIEIQQCARDQDGRMLVWAGDISTTHETIPSPAATPTSLQVKDQERDPASYTPQHLAEKILTSRSALEGERKQVTVLFADVAGFSTLSERLDPEAIHFIMDGCFDILTRHVHHYEGTINQFTGDGIMALFGAPITHEDHTVRALHAALDIQEAMRDYGDAVQRQWSVPFQMRLGLNTGTVVVGRIGDDLRMDYTAQGDTTNLAARMQQMAPSGDIWVADATYRVAPEAFEWLALGAQGVKGKIESVPVYELRGRRDLHSRFDVLARRGLTPLVGRDTELAQILNAWDKAQQGHGQVVSIVGEAGLGKSRLLYEFKQRLLQQGVHCVEGTCFTYGESISYLPFLDVVQTLCDLEPNHSEVEAKQHIVHRLATLDLQPSAVAPYLHNLLSLQVEDEVFPKLTPELIRRRTVEALKTLVFAETHHQPLALVLEDVHWIDKATEEVLGTLVEAMADVPLLIVLVYRPAYVQSWIVQAIQTKAYAHQVHMAPLSMAQRTEMTQALLGAIPTELEQLIVGKTDGNPLFVEELCRSLVESGALAQAADHYVLHAPLDALDIPTTLQGVLLARIDRLPEALKDMLQRAAVIGRIFTHSLLSQVVDSGTALEPLLEQLEKLEFIYPSSLAPQREYSFKHVLTRESVYQTLLRPRREAYHERVGKAIEALYPDRLEESYELLAYHYGRGGNSDKAVEYLELANRKAARANAMQEAKVAFDAAMTHLDALPDTPVNQQRRVTLLVNQGVVMLLLFRLPEYHDFLSRYESMALALDNPGLVGAFQGRIGFCRWSFGDFDRAIPILTQAASTCEAAGNAEDAGQAYCHLLWSHWCKANYEQVFATRGAFLRTTEGGFNLRWYLYVLTGASLASAYLGRWEDAVQEATKALRLGEEFADHGVMSFANITLANAYIYKGDVVRGLEHAEIAFEQAPTFADRVWIQGWLGWALCRSGELLRGIEMLEQGVSIQREAHFYASELFAPFLGEGYWMAGEYEQAMRTLKEHLAIVEPWGMRFQIGSAYRLLGELSLQTDSRQAGFHFERSIAVLSEINAENELALAYAGYGRLHAQQGDRVQARKYLTRALTIFERLGTLGEPEKVSRALSALSEG
jgi:class 3 adenylate cyclase/tetratricopeptide (TPR) repeat protein